MKTREEQEIKVPYTLVQVMKIQEGNDFIHYEGLITWSRFNNKVKNHKQGSYRY